MAPDFLAQLASSGVLGVVVIVLWREYVALQVRLEQVQNKRVEDAETYASKMLEVAKAIHDNTAATRELVRAIEDRRDR